MYDFAIIGHGIAGAAAAAALAAAGARVVIVEREAQGSYHTTGRSAAVLAEYVSDPATEPLVTYSKAILANPEGHFRADSLLRRRGSVIGSFSGVSAKGADDRIASLVANRHLEWLSETHVRKLCPFLAEHAVQSAAYDPSTSDIDVNGLFSGFTRHARSFGCNVTSTSEVLSLHRQAGRWTVTVSGSSIEATTIVNASGAWADAVAELAGARPVGLQVLKRTILACEVPSAASWGHAPLIDEIDEAFYIKPESNGLLISPADETPVAPQDAAPDYEDIAGCLDRLNEITTLGVRRPSHAWAGLRVFGPDRLPVIGPDPNIEDFYWLAGLGGIGISIAPAVSRICSSDLCGDSLPPELAAEIASRFRVERCFAGADHD